MTSILYDLTSLFVADTVNVIQAADEDAESLPPPIDAGLLLAGLVDLADVQRMDAEMLVHRNSALASVWLPLPVFEQTTKRTFHA